MKELRDQLAGKCKHFNGTMSKVCEAGVNYDDVKQPPGDGKGFLLPCLKEDGVSDKCALCQFPTEAEVAAELAGMNERMEKMTKARKVIVAHLGRWMKGDPGAAGTVACPNCDGRIAFSRAAYNGHIQATCSGPCRVSWME